MMSIIRFLFPVKPDGWGISMLLLSLRILFGVLLLTHGIQKWANFSEMSGSFPDPMGVGSNISLGLAIFAEVACSIGFIFGAFYRLVLIPMIFTMGMAFFVIHAGDPFAAKELAFAYGMVYFIMFLAGPGKFSLDRMLATALAKKK